ncbi:MAG: hypothetical protein PHH54_05830 [Candidatus Nanoarchaeia archaeon]|nr:hypothetical protein [Candidatus Nanoarchaeia archaeon]MDD5741475.1 hypothetical protein [Candidatus Nanoarchaeia archaeon]
MNIINTTNINEARKEILKLKKENKKVIVQAQDDEFNRKIFENKDVDIVTGLEFNRKDRLKQRDSGLNEVLCKLASKNNIKISIDIREIQKLPKKEKAIILSRIIQNIKLCRRTKTEIIFIPELKKQDAFSFLLALGASTNQAIPE